jgi:hypothetical protein
MLLDVLVGKAVDVGAGAASPPTLDDGGTRPGAPYLPGQIFAASSTAKDEGFKLSRLRHGNLREQSALVVASQQLFWGNRDTGV